MKSNETVKMNIFGKERELKIILVGDNEPNYTENAEEIVKLVPKEEELLNWFLHIDFSEYKEKIQKYINYVGHECCGLRKISKRKIAKDKYFLPVGIIINVIKDMDDETAEIALYAESDYLEDAVTIAFKNGKYFGMTGFDDCMNCFEDEFYEK